MKKYFTIIVVSVMLFILLCGCSTKSENTDTVLSTKGENTDIVLYTKGLELIHRMDMMAENENYINLMSASAELKEIINGIGNNNYSEPNAVYKITLPEGATASVFEDGEITEMPEEIKTEIEKRLLTVIPSQVNALNGSTVLAATSIITFGDSFINEDLNNNTIYIYLYEGEYSAMVSFFPGNENIVGASAYFVINDSLNQISSDSEMSEWIKKCLPLTDYETEKVELAK